MDVSAHRITSITAGPNKGYNDANLDGFYFHITLVNEDGVESDIALHCTPDCKFNGFYRQNDMDKLSKEIDRLSNIIKPEAD